MDEHITTGKETVRAPGASAAIDVGSGGAGDHPKILDGRCRGAARVGDWRGLGINWGRIHCPPPPDRKGAAEYEDGRGAGNRPVRKPVPPCCKTHLFRGYLNRCRLRRWRLDGRRLSRRRLPPEFG